MNEVCTVKVLPKRYSLHWVRTGEQGTEGLWVVGLRGSVEGGVKTQEEGPLRVLEV